MFRLGDVGRAESLLIAHLADVPQEQQSSSLSLLAWMRLENRDLAGFKTVFRTLQFHWPDHPEVQALLFKSLLVTRRGHSIVSSPAQWASVSDPQLRLVFQLLHIEWLVIVGRVQEAKSLLTQSLQSISLEASILAARCEKAQETYWCTWSFYDSFERAPSSLQLWLYALETALDAKHSDAVLTLARQALNRFGETPRILEHLAPIKLLQRQPGLARRSALLNRLWTTTLLLPSGRPVNQ